jgi:predicted transposase/invertase (TIGR01784 family)
LKNLEDLDKIPEILKEPIFVRGFQIAEIAAFDERQRELYEESLKAYRDIKGVIETSFEEGEKIGIEKGERIGIKKNAIDTALKMKKKGFSIEEIAELTALSTAEIEAL